jgi:tryptophan-rich sensory protein
MTTTAGHSFYIGPIGLFYNQVNDTGFLEPLVVFGLVWFVLFCFVLSSRERVWKSVFGLLNIRLLYKLSFQYFHYEHAAYLMNDSLLD